MLILSLKLTSLFSLMTKFHFLMHTGELVSGTECLEYTHDYLKNESIYRTVGNTNYKKYSSLPKVSPEVLRLARTLANSEGLRNIRATIIKKQYILSKDGKKIKDELAIKMINTSNANRYVSWEERESFSKSYYVISPISNERSENSSSKYSCTCQTYVDKYECEHSLAISIIKNQLTESISMDMPLGLKKSRGRPVKAVKGALNRQPELNQKVALKSTGAKKVILEKKVNHYIDLGSDIGKEYITTFFVLLYLSILCSNINIITLTIR
jgi:hypothetical protein